MPKKKSEQKAIPAAQISQTTSNTAQPQDVTEAQIQLWRKQAGENYVKYTTHKKIQHVKMAYSFYKKAADAGDPFAQALVWDIVVKNQHIFKEKEHLKVLDDYLEIAVGSGNIHAKYRLGLNYKNGENGYSQDSKKAFEQFKEASGAKDIYAMSELAISYMDGVGTPVDGKRAFILLQHLASKPIHDIKFFNLEFCFEKLGICYEMGIGCSTDIKKAIQLYRDKIPLLNKKIAAFLKYRLALCLLKDSPKEIPEILSLLKDAIKEGDKNAMYELGSLYYEGRLPDLKKDHEKAYTYYKMAADLNCGNDASKALYMVGIHLYYGLGVKQDKKTGVENIERAAGLGVKEAQVCLGKFYLHGVDKPKNIPLAVKNFKAASEAGEVLAMAAMARFHWMGVISQDKTPNKEETLKHFQKIHNKDPKNTYGLINLGLCFLNGIGTTQDEKTAAEYFSKAVELLFQKSKNLTSEECNNLGWCYLLGFGVPQDFKKAIEAFTLASEADYKLAKNALAWCHLNGFGVPQDANKALDFFKTSEKVHFGFGDEVDESTTEFLDVVYKDSADTIQINIAQCELYGLGTSLERVNALNRLEGVVDRGCEKTNTGKESKEPQENMSVAAEILVAVCYFNHWTDKEQNPGSNNFVALGILERYQNVSSYLSELYRGICWYYGIVIKKDEKAGIQCLQRADAILTAKKDPFAQNMAILHDFAIAKDPHCFPYHAKFLLGLAYSSSKMLATWLRDDPVEGINALRMATDHFNDPKAKALLAIAYMTGFNIPKDANLGVHLLQEAAFLNKDPIALKYLEKYITSEKIIKLSNVQALKLYEDVSRFGSANLRFQLAKILCRNNQVGLDYKKIFDLCQSAADMGHIKAHRVLGEIYSRGFGSIAIDKTKAFEHWRAAAIGDDPVANKYVRLCYKTGEGTSVNLVLASHFLKEARFLIEQTSLEDNPLFGNGKLGEVDPGDVIEEMINDIVQDLFCELSLYQPSETVKSAIAPADKVRDLHFAFRSQGSESLESSKDSQEKSKGLSESLTDAKPMAKVSTEARFI